MSYLCPRALLSLPVLFAAAGCGESSEGPSSGETGGGHATHGAGAGGAGGSGSTSAGGSAPVSCADGILDLPSGAPALVPGVLENISPTEGGYWANGVVFDPCNPAVLYSAGGDYTSIGGSGEKLGVFRSTDAGSTWEQLVHLDSSARVRIDPRNPKNLYVIDGVNGGTHGFWRSRDGGKNWEIPQGFKDAVAQPNVSCDDAYDVAPDPSDFDHVLVTFHNPWAGYDGAAGILESFDAGKTWTVHEPEPAWKQGYGYDVFFLYDPELGIGDSKTWLFTLQGDGYYRTTDGGGSWTKVADTAMAHGGAQLTYTKDKVLYVTTISGLIRSTDNGASFTPVLPTGNTFSQFLGLGFDGKRLFAGASTGGDLLTAPLGDDENWTTYNGQTFANAGPYEMRYDSAHGILYSANAPGGLWALKLE